LSDEIEKRVVSGTTAATPLASLTGEADYQTYHFHARARMRIHARGKMVLMVYEVMYL
jgi:hypothetical protein